METGASLDIEVNKHEKSNSLHRVVSNTRNNIKKGENEADLTSIVNKYDNSLNLEHGNIIHNNIDTIESDIRDKNERNKAKNSLLGLETNKDTDKDKLSSKPKEFYSGLYIPDSINKKTETKTETKIGTKAEKEKDKDKVKLDSYTSLSAQSDKKTTNQCNSKVKAKPITTFSATSSVQEIENAENIIAKDITSSNISQYFIGLFKRFLLNGISSLEKNEIITIILALLLFSWFLLDPLLIGFLLGCLIAMQYGSQSVTLLPTPNNENKKTDDFSNNPSLKEISYIQRKGSITNIPPITQIQVRRSIDCIISNYITFWYRPLTADQSFPMSCRIILEDVFSSVVYHIESKNPPELLINTLYTVSATMVTFMNELCASLKYQGDLRLYMETNPNSSLSVMCDHDHQRAKVKIFVLHFLDSFVLHTHLESAPVANFLREIIASQVIENIIKHFSQADVINNWIITIFKGNKQDTTTPAKTAIATANIIESTLLPNEETSGNSNNDLIDDSVSSSKTNSKRNSKNYSKNSINDNSTNPNSSLNSNNNLTTQKEAVSDVLTTLSSDASKVEDIIKKNSKAVDKTIFDQPLRSSLTEKRTKSEDKDEFTLYDDESSKNRKSLEKNESNLLKNSHSNSNSIQKVNSYENDMLIKREMSTPVTRGSFSSIGSISDEADIANHKNSFDSWTQGNSKANSQSDSPSTLSLNHLLHSEITVTDISDRSSATKFKNRKSVNNVSNPQYMISIEPRGEHVTGWIIIRDYNSFNKLNYVLQKMAALGGIDILPDFPSNKIDSEALRSSLEDYLIIVINTKEFVSSEAFKRFVSKDEGQGQGQQESKTLKESFDLTPTDSAADRKSWTGGVIDIKQAGEDVLGALAKSSTEGHHALVELKKRASSFKWPKGFKKETTSSIGYDPIGNSNSSSSNKSNNDKISESHSSHSSITQSHSINDDSINNDYESHDSDLSVKPFHHSSHDLDKELKHEIRKEIKEKKKEEKNERKYEKELKKRKEEEMHSSKKSREIAKKLEKLKKEEAEQMELYNTDDENIDIDLPPPPSEISDDYIPVGENDDDEINEKDDNNSNDLKESKHNHKKGKAKEKQNQNQTDNDYNSISESEDKNQNKTKNGETKRWELNTQETQYVVDIYFAVIYEFLTIGNSWTIRKSLLNIIRGVILRNGSSSIESIRKIINQMMLEFSTDEKISSILKHMNNSLWGEESQDNNHRYIRPQKDPLTPEESTALYDEAKKLFIANGIPDNLRSIVGSKACDGTLEMVFEALQDEEIARGLVTNILLGLLTCLTT